jgi:hypothetical protein
LILFNTQVNDILVQKPHGGVVEHHVQNLIGTDYYLCVDCHKWFHKYMDIHFNYEYARSRWLYAMIAILLNNVYSMIINVNDWFDNRKYGCIDNE